MGSNREVATGLWPVAGRAAGEAHEPRPQGEAGDPNGPPCEWGAPETGRFLVREGCAV